MKTHLKFLPLLLLAFLISCQTGQNDEQVEQLPNINQVVSQSVIYEVNLRQYTPEGTIAAFKNHIPRLKSLGVDILWFMPIHPISVEKRKGNLGSYYAVADYKAVNPEFGTFGEFKALVELAHENGMYVILDWVANHTGWDNPWIYNNPEWYTTNELGEIIAPVEDWTDVADLNYDNYQMRTTMTDALKFWVKEANIDGYRCDVAGSVPVDYWDSARMALDSIKPVFMLAEAWEPELLHNAFDMAYAWNGHHIMNEIAQGKQHVSDLKNYFTDYLDQYQEDDFLMNFITNHDENSWNGTEYERMGNGVECWTVFSYTIPGMPLIYSGQEAALNKRLEFFEKDEIDWSDTTLYTLYRKLDKLKSSNAALGVGVDAGKMNILPSTDTNVFAFERQNETDYVLAVFNLSENTVSTTIDSLVAGTYTDFETNSAVQINSSFSLDLDPWHYKVIYK